MTGAMGISPAHCRKNAKPLKQVRGRDRQQTECAQNLKPGAEPPPMLEPSQAPDEYR